MDRCASRIRLAKDELKSKRETRDLYLGTVQLQWSIRRSRQRQRYFAMRANGGQVPQQSAVGVGADDEDSAAGM